MFVIAGVTGNTGRVVAESLLKQGRKVRVVVRAEAKGAEWKARGAEVAVAEIGDGAALGRALAGAEGAYLLLPPDAQSTDFIARGRRLVGAITEALAASPVPHVVLLSSVGAQHAAGTGPIKTLHHAEAALRALPRTRFTFLRAAYFMENILGFVQPMREQGVLPVFGGGETYPFAMVATRDIGEAAARALLEPPAATQVIELAGPAEYSFADAARVFGEALGRAVNPVALPIEGMVPALTGLGMSADVAGQYREMTEGLGKGLLAWEGFASRAQRGAVSLADFARGALKQA